MKRFRKQVNNLLIEEVGYYPSTYLRVRSLNGKIEKYFGPRNERNIQAAIEFAQKNGQKHHPGKREARRIIKQFLQERDDKIIIPLWLIVDTVEYELERELCPSIFDYEVLLPSGTETGWFNTSNLETLVPGDLYCVINPFCQKPTPPKAQTKSPVGRLTATEYHGSWF